MAVSLAMDPRLILCHKHLSLLILILLQGNYATQAQFLAPSPPSNSTATGFSTATAVIFGALVFLFFGIAVFSLCYYQRNYVNDISTTRPGVGTAPTTTSASGENHIQKGIDQSVLETFPIMGYAAVKKLSTVKGPLECAVCLLEFADDDSLKLLPGCCHVFHPECIDQWLENHITCPVCRADLSNPSVTIGDMDDTSEAAGTGTVATDGGEDIHDGESGEPSTAVHTVDRFTLRLPRHMIKEIEEARKYRRSMSIAGYAYERKGSIIGKSGRLRGIIRSFSSVLRREPDVGSSRVFTLNEVSELPMNTRSTGSSSLSGENQIQRSPSNVSHMALLDRV